MILLICIRNYSQTGSPAECLSETAELLHIPENVLTLTSLTEDDHIDGIYSYIVCTKKLLQKNTSFGPYKGEIISTTSVDSSSIEENRSDQKEDNNNNNKNVNNSSTMTVHLREESGNWLKILRTANNEQEANATIRVEGNHSIHSYNGLYKYIKLILI